jgi:hypothetical protein
MKSNINYKVQSILIPKENFTLEEAIQFVKENYIFKKVDFPPSSKFYRFRQYSPKHLTNVLKLNNVKTVKDKKTGIEKIIYFNP